MNKSHVLDIYICNIYYTIYRSWATLRTSKALRTFGSRIHSHACMWSTRLALKHIQDSRETEKSHSIKTKQKKKVDRSNVRSSGVWNRQRARRERRRVLNVASIFIESESSPTAVCIYTERDRDTRVCGAKGRSRVQRKETRTWHLGSSLDVYIYSIYMCIRRHRLAGLHWYI